MEECKICNKEFKKLLGLSSHLKSIHNISLLEHHVSYNNFKVPKCEICNENNSKHYYGLVFRKTCHDKKCYIEFCERRKHSEETKKKQSKSRYAYMKKNPEKISWMLRNQISYPEKVFMDALEKQGLFNKFEIVREKSFYPYFADFAFENVKVVVEIDGQQHFRYQERIDSDRKKDALIISMGWRVYRVKASQVLNDVSDIMNEVLEFIGDIKIISKTSEIITAKEKKDAEKRKQRKVKEEKKKILVEERRKAFELVDISRFGWVQKLSEVWELSHTQTKRWLKRYYPELEYYQRKS